MSPTMKDLGLDRLSVDDRITLVQELWDSIAADAAKLPLTESQQRELDRRLAEHETSPGDIIPWEDVKARSQARARMERE
jgi:putative addiction module component (TIGR02574 family)